MTSPCARDRLRPRVLALVGPTCSGKTALSLAIAEHLPSEIVACDSRTIYRYMDIGTAKPSPAEQAAVRHHMLDIVDPDQSYTAALYKREASEIIFQIARRGRIPLVVGGTGFYARSLLEGLSIPAVPPQIELRRELNQLADKEGNAALHAKLQEIDASSAARIGVNDRFRLVRALEVTFILGIPFSQAATRVEPPFDTIWVGLTAEDRSMLYTAIRKRFHQQMHDGLLEEVEGLLQRFGACQALLNTVNYLQLVQYLAGKISREKAEEDSVRSNCQLARRQLIWFRKNDQILWLPADKLSGKELAEATLAAMLRTWRTTDQVDD